MDVVQCRHCGKHFFRSTRHKRYCSSECMRDHEKEARVDRYWKNREVSVVEHTCKQCGISYSDRKDEFCSPECKYLYTWSHGKSRKCPKKFSF